MKEPREDDERLSALLDGQVSGPERDALLAHLASSHDDYAVFNDAAEILDALEDEDASTRGPDAPATVIPLPQPRRHWRPPVRWVALAAVLAGVVLLYTLALPGGTPTGGDPVRLAAAVYEPGQAVPARLTEAWPWSVDRGGGTPGDRSDAVAARAGAMMVRLSVAVRARDTAVTGRVARQMQRFEPEIGGATPLREIARQPGAPPQVLEGLLKRARDRLADSFEEDYLQLGAWTEAALLATNARNGDFFRSASSRKMLDRAERLTRDDVAAQDAVKQVRAARPAEESPNWAALEPALNDFLRAIAS